MNTPVNVHDLKTHYSKYLEQVMHGEEIILGKHGKPVAKIVPLPQKSRKPGALKGRIWIAEDFDEPLTDWMTAIEQKKR
ncbi:MAG TPA: type II toxin-antitoxin system Phd/YefM family antitoxin [Candidatus Limnocylindria bacterium]|nr:type II toxin-antitoxin system Phd/YefM family antitoxin [Candidatus Limnocylindria bacterium]